MSDRMTQTAVGVSAVTPSDTVSIARPVRALWVGTFGDLAVVMADDTTATLQGCQGLVPVQCVRVNATGTTATNIVAMH